MTANKRSPLKDRPLRNPGQSVDEQRFHLVYDKILTPFLIASLVCILAVIEWWHYFRPAAPAPKTYTLMALLGIGYCAFQVWRVWPQVRQLRLASEGEKAVGQYLERLREKGYQVFHDVIGEGFNLDHVVIGPAGVFTIETKTWSKPVRGNPKIVFDGQRILVAGHEPDRDPLVQAKAQASWLRELLHGSTGRQFNVRPVIVFPGWFIEQSPGTSKAIWVLEPKALPGFLSNEPALISSEDMNLASFHLSRFVRSNEQRKAGV